MEKFHEMEPRFCAVHVWTRISCVWAVVFCAFHLVFYIIIFIYFFLSSYFAGNKGSVVCVCIMEKSSFIAFVPRNSILIGIGSDAGAQLWRCRHISFALLSLSLSLSNTTPRRWGTIYTARYNTYTWNNTSKYIGTGREICTSDEACIHYPRSQNRARLKILFTTFLGYPNCCLVSLFSFVLFFCISPWFGRLVPLLFPIVLLQSDVCCA